MDRLIIIEGATLAFAECGENLRLPGPEECPEVRAAFSFTRGCHSCKVAYMAAPAGMTSLGLREAWPRLDSEEYALAAKGLELANWDRSSRFCPRCGAPVRWHSPISKMCENCSHEYFPQLSPAIIVLIRRGDEALLVHARTFTRPFFGLVAGFVETGETLEECVEREVMEETSLRIKNVRYAGSQAWPYPSNLMIGFTADYAGGELRFADGELTEGGFFDREHLPPLPTPPSIARRLIDEWISNF